jgi:hypothetical protein
MSGSGGPWVAVAGGLALWAAFLTLAVIARKFEGIFERRTRWAWMAAAPSGLVVYALLAVAGLGGVDPDAARELSYWLLLASGVLCALGAGRFRAMLRSLEDKES